MLLEKMRPPYSVSATPRKIELLAGATLYTSQGPFQPGAALGALYIEVPRPLTYLPGIVK